MIQSGPDLPVRPQQALAGDQRRVAARRAHAAALSARRGVSRSSAPISCSLAPTRAPNLNPVFLKMSMASRVEGVRFPDSNSLA